MSKSRISYKVISESGYQYYPSTKSETSILDQIEDFRIGEDWWLVEEYLLNEEQKSDVIIEMVGGVIKKLRDPQPNKEYMKYIVTFSDHTTEVIGRREFQNRFNTVAREWKWRPIEDEYDNLYSSDFYDRYKMIKVEREVPIKKKKYVPRSELILPVLPSNPTTAERRSFNRYMREYNKKLDRLKANDLL